MGVQWDMATTNNINRGTCRREDLGKDHDCGLWRDYGRCEMQELLWNKNEDENVKSGELLATNLRIYYQKEENKILNHCVFSIPIIHSVFKLSLIHI